MKTLAAKTKFSRRTYREVGCVTAHYREVAPVGGRRKITLNIPKGKTIDVFVYTLSPKAYSASQFASDVKKASPKLEAMASRALKNLRDGKSRRFNP